MMLNFLLRRIYASIATFFIVISLVFFIIRLTGDPLADLEDYPGITPEIIDSMRTLFGLNKPLYAQYFDFIVNLFKGQLGYSLLYKKPVAEVILNRLPYTLALLIPSVTLSNYIAYKLGLECGWRRRGAIGLTLLFLSIIFTSIPYFCFAFLFLYLFSVRLGVTPVFGAISPNDNAPFLSLNWFEDYMRHYILPFIVLTLRESLILIPYIRGIVVEVLGEDYITTAYAKGLPTKAIKYRYVARNVLPPIMTVMGLRYASLVDGAVITETIFSYPGTGRLVFEAIVNRDYWLLQGAVIILTLNVIIVNFIIDLIYLVLDPRIRFR